ncbi:MAG: acetate--CoA ligase family protein [Singulisphaera sp.]
MLGDADPGRYAKALEVAARDPNTDGLLVVLTPQAMTDPTQTAEGLKGYAHLEGKPVLASWMGGTDVSAGEAILQKAGIPTFAFPDTAARAFNAMWRSGHDLRALYETPTGRVGPDQDEPDRDRAGALIQAVRTSGRVLLTEAESKQLLAFYGIPTVPTHVAATRAGRPRRRDRLPGRPEALLETITHKTDVGGVRLNLGDADTVRAYRRSRRRCATRRRRAFPGRDRPADGQARWL